MARTGWARALDPVNQCQSRRHADRCCSRLAQVRGRADRLFDGVDPGVDSEALPQRLLDEGHLTTAGSPFRALRTPAPLMRFDVVTTLCCTLRLLLI
jgi:hypothetical protein